MAKKKVDDLFGDDEDLAPKRSEDFESLLKASSMPTRHLVAGDRLRGEVLAVHAQEAFVSTGSPIDATMPLSKDPNFPMPSVGTFIDVVVVRVREGEILVKALGSRGNGADAESLEDAFDMELPVEGLVVEAVKGGFRIKIQGQKAFCPISQIDWRCVNPDDYVGKKFSFIITKMDRGRDLVVSRRKILAMDRAGSEAEFIKTAEVGAIFAGTIFRVEKYGAFIRLQNAIEGLIPISELSWSRIGHPLEVVSLDQPVEVKLISMTEEGDRLKVSFSLKQGGSVADPWASLEGMYPVGTSLEGVVEHKAEFGLFVSIALGVTGLLPRSAWRDTTEASAYENRRKGDQVKVRIEKIDSDNRKLSLSLPRDDEDDSWRSHASMGTVAKPSQSSFGNFGDLLKGVKVK